MNLLFHDITQGKLCAELLSLRLESERYGSYSGQGFLRWNQNDGLEIDALTEGGRAAANSGFDGVVPPVGRLIPPNDYYRLTATTRGGGSVVADRLAGDGRNVYSSHETVVWNIGRPHVRSIVDFSRGDIAGKTDSINFLLSNGKGVVWPRVSSAGGGGLQVEFKLGHITAYAMPHGNLVVRISLSTAQELTRIVDAVGFSFAFWAGKILPVIAYEAHHDDSLLCRLFPWHDDRSHATTPPFGYGDSLSLETHHETLIQRAMNFFTGDERGKIGPLIHTRLSCPDAPFSVGFLILCAALEGMAKEVSKETGVSPEISAEQRTAVLACFANGGLTEEMAERFNNWVSVANAPSAANAISRWCESGFLGFSADDFDAWRLRNKPAHGNFALYGDAFEDRKVSVARRDRLGNMINRLVMHAIGFEGKYLDYATYREEIFPPPVIREATLQEVHDFFRHVIDTRFDGMIPALLDSGRLTTKTECFAAEVDGAIVGVVTLVFDGLNGPTLDVQFTLPDYCRRGIGTRLCERAMRRFVAAGVASVYCEAESSGMHNLIQRLPDDLRAFVRENPLYLSSDMDQETLT